MERRPDDMDVNGSPADAGSSASDEPHSAARPREHAPEAGPAARTRPPAHSGEPAPTHARKTRNRRRLIIAVDAALLVLLVFLLYQRALPQASAALGFGASNEPAPLFALRSLDGDTVSLESLRGQVVLVNFWASWCPPCRVEMPGFERIYRQRAAEGFTIVGIATDVFAEERIRAFVEEHDITYPILLADPRVIREYGGINALPESFLLDREGRIRHRVIGYFAEPALRAAVNRMMETGS